MAQNVMKNQSMMESFYGREGGIRDKKFVVPSEKQRVTSLGSDPN